MYTLKEYYPEMDLSQFYEEARKRNYHNNDSYESMIKPFEDMHSKKILILSYNDKIVGSSISHPFLDGHRIFARLCVFTDLTPFKRCGTVKAFKEHQHITARFFLPEHAKLKGPLYFTTHPEPIAKMKGVHNNATKWFEQAGVVGWLGDMNYRGCVQSVWKVNTQKWLNDMNKYPIYYDNLNK